MEWHLSSLDEYQDWRVSTLRESYDGRIMMLYPSWGIRPGRAEEAVKTNLEGSASPEKNGEIQRGLDFEHQVEAIEDEDVLVKTTWLEANVDIAADDRSDPRRWSPVHYLASLAQDHPLSLQLYGENGGRDDLAGMKPAASQMRKYGITGMAWYNERELFSGRFATLDDYQRIIETSQEVG